MHDLVIAEGARNVGKTFLLSHAPRPTYKLPFAGYFNSHLTLEDATLVTGIESHRFTAGYDLTLLGLYKAGMLKPCVVDRGFLSNVVFDVMQDRITGRQAEDYIRFLASHGLLRDVTVLHVLGHGIPDLRGKDRWAFLEAPEYAGLYARFSEFAQQMEPRLHLLEFQNNFDDASWQRFMRLFDQQMPAEAV